MGMEEPDVKRVLQALTEVVEELGPEHVYQQHNNNNTSFNCTYVWEGEPDCIAARVLVKLGVATVEQLSQHEGDGCIAFHWTGLSSNALMVLRLAQTIQDGGEWNEALRDVDRTYGFALARAKVYAVAHGWLDQPTGTEQ